MSVDLVTDIVILESQIESLTSSLNELKVKVNKLANKHQSMADQYHRTAEGLWQLTKTESVRYDALAHPHEQFAAELRLILK